MHDAAYQFVQRLAEGLSPRRKTVCELGSRDVNGSVRPLFCGCAYTGVDIVKGPGVDVVADAATWDSPQKFDCIICMETLEHTPDGKAIVRNAHKLLAKDGLLIVTTAGPGRRPHSATGSESVGGEWYRNIRPGELAEWLEPFGLSHVDYWTNPGDLYGWAVR